MKKGLILFSLLVVSIGVSFLFYEKNKEEKENEKEIMKQAVENYLFEKKEYTKEDIKSIEMHYNDKANGINSKWYAYVVYSDEPYTTYIYFVNKENREVQHGGYANNDPNTVPKHEEDK